MERFDFHRLVPGEDRAGAACLRSRESRKTRKGQTSLTLAFSNAAVWDYAAAVAEEERDHLRDVAPVHDEPVLAWEVDEGQPVALVTGMGGDHA